MDPDACLQSMRACYEQMLDPSFEKCTNKEKEEISLELAGHIEALDMWLSSGGFPPDEWRTK